MRIRLPAGTARSRGRACFALARLLALTAVGHLGACAARNRLAPAAQPLEAALAANPAVGQALAGLTPAQRAAALTVLRSGAERDAPAVARLAAAGKSAAEIIAALPQGDAAGNAADRPAGGTAAADARAGAGASAGAAAGAGPPPPPAEYHRAEPAAWSPVRGPALAKVTLVVFSDFQCPFCARVEPTYRRLQERYPDDLRIVWRNQPLPFHRDSMPAAEAAMAAHAQGRFWEMHDKLFEDAAHLDADSLRRQAAAIGLDLKRYDDDLAAHRYQAQVEGDIQQGAAWGVTGTPTSFINGRKIAGAYPLATFEAAIGEELARADAVLARGVPPAELYAAILAQNPLPPPSAAVPAEEEEETVAAIDIPADAPARGPHRAPVTLVEYSDFQCPYCARAQKSLLAVEDRYRGKIRRVFLHLPLPFHDHAQLAAEAAMAANAQGKFWAMHDLLFDNQGSLERADLDRYAAQAGLDPTRFAAALDRHTFAGRVAADVGQAERLGIDGTPTFFVNGIKLVGAQPAQRFAALVERALKAAPASRPRSRGARKR